MLSAVDPVSGQYIRDVDGKPVHQRNILYYLVRPNNHNAISRGYACTIDDATHTLADPYCPHKILIRKVIRKEAAGVPEELLTTTEVDAYLTLPNGYDVSGMVGEEGFPGVEPGTIKNVGFGLLSFRVDALNPPFFNLTFRAIRLAEAERKISVGSTPLNTGRFTVEIRRSIFPRN